MIALEISSRNARIHGGRRPRRYRAADHRTL